MHFSFFLSLSLPLWVTLYVIIFIYIYISRSFYISLIPYKMDIEEVFKATNPQRIHTILQHTSAYLYEYPSVIFCHNGVVYSINITPTILLLLMLIWYFKSILRPIFYLWESKFTDIHLYLQFNIYGFNEIFSYIIYIYNLKCFLYFHVIINAKKL